METKKNQKLEVKQSYEISFEDENQFILNEVALTEKTITQLLSLQDDENHLINHFKEKIADAICYISADISNNEVLKDAGPIIQELSAIRNIFNDFKKP